MEKEARLQLERFCEFLEKRGVLNSIFTNEHLVEMFLNKKNNMASRIKPLEEMLPEDRIKQGVLSYKEFSAVNQTRIRAAVVD